MYVCNLLIVQMTETEGQPDSGSATAGGNVLRRNSDDVGWEFGVLVNPNNKVCLSKLFMISGI